MLPHLALLGLYAVSLAGQALAHKQGMLSDLCRRHACSQPSWFPMVVLCRSMCCNQWGQSLRPSFPLCCQLPCSMLKRLSRGWLLVTHCTATWPKRLLNGSKQTADVPCSQTVFDLTRRKCHRNSNRLDLTWHCQIKQTPHVNGAMEAKGAQKVDWQNCLSSGGLTHDARAKEPFGMYVSPTGLRVRLERCNASWEV